MWFRKLIPSLIQDLINFFLYFSAGGLFLMSRLVKSVTENFSDMDSWREISDTFADNKDKLMGAETACEQACERIKLNAAWRFKDIDNLRYFLQSDEAIFQ